MSYCLKKLPRYQKSAPGYSKSVVEIKKLPQKREVGEIKTLILKSFTDTQKANLILKIIILISKKCTDLKKLHDKKFSA